MVSSSQPVTVLFKRLHPDAVLPVKKTRGSSGADVCAVEDVQIPPGEVRLVSLGFAVAIPLGVEIQIRPRSGLALEEQITVLNTPGTIDSDYRGEMKVIVANFGTKDFHVKKGARIAQAVVSYVPDFIYEEVEELDNTERGAGGFGSTGRN